MFSLCNSITVAALLTVSSTSMATVQSDSPKDSVSSWGPWEGVKTAAGSVVQQIPLRVGFVSSRDQVDSQAFEAGVDKADGVKWKGYIGLASNVDSENVTGSVEFLLNPETDSVMATVRLKDGRVKVLDQESHFYETGEFPELWGADQEMDAGYKYRQFIVKGDGGDFFQTSQATHWNYGVRGGDEVTNGDVRIDDSAHQRSWFVAGLPTVMSDLQKLNLGNVTASYQGYGWYAGAGYAANTMNVNFGAKTWSGNWGDRVAVQAEGVLTADGFQSTSVTGNDVTAGSIEGTFYGAGAKSLGGALDVDKVGVPKIVGAFINEQVQP